MINETLVSFKDLFKSKVRNPIFGTLAIVWVIHNWDLVFSLVNFDKEWDRQQKITYLSEYFHDPGFILNMAICVGIAIIVLIASFALMNISKLIVNTSTDIVGPFLQKLTDVNKIVTRKELEEVKQDRDRIQRKYEVESSARRRLLSEYDELEKLYTQAVESGGGENASQHVLDGKLLLEYQKFKSKGLIELFNQLLDSQMNGQSMSLSNDEIDDLIDLGVVSEKRDPIQNDDVKYELTYKGNAFRIFLDAGL